jgi:rhodanese-related sulfurtransferase
MPKTAEDLLREARSRLDRVSAERARREQDEGALLIDVRTEPQRAVQGSIPGALAIDLTVLEWRLDPTAPTRIPEAVDHDVRVILVCRQGFSSSLAAARLQDLGLHRATDIEGGFEAWVSAGLPVDLPPA